MELIRLEAKHMDNLWELQLKYKAEILEDAPASEDRRRLEEAIREGAIFFYGAMENDLMVGCCSVTKGFSTYDYRPSGVFEDLYVLPEYRGRGIAKELAKFAYEKSGVSTLTVGCSDGDTEMYQALGFSEKIGNLMSMGNV